MKKYLILSVLFALFFFQPVTAQECSSYIEENETGTLGKNVETTELLLGKKIGRMNFELFLESLLLHCLKKEQVTTSPHASCRKVILSRVVKKE